MKRTKAYQAGLLSLSLLLSGMFSSCANDDPPKPYGVLPSPDQMEWQKNGILYVYPFRPQYIYRCGVG